MDSKNGYSIISQVILIALSACMLTNCTVQKRHYRPGYAFSKKHRSLEQISQSNHQSENEKERVSFSDSMQTPLIAGTNSDISFILNNDKSHDYTSNSGSLPADSCVLVEFYDGRIINANILHLDSITIKYKKCGVFNGFSYDDSAKDIKKIVYADGTVKEFKKPTVKTLFGEKAVKKKRGYNYALASKQFSSIGLIPAIGIVFCLIGIMLGLIALKKIKKNPDSFMDKAEAKKGIRRGLWFILINLLICALIGCIIMVLMLVLFII